MLERLVGLLLTLGLIFGAAALWGDAAGEAGAPWLGRVAEPLGTWAAGDDRAERDADEDDDDEDEREREREREKEEKDEKKGEGKGKGRGRGRD